VVGGEAVQMAQLAHRRLWERDPSDPDYLEVCIGLATQPSAIRTSRDRDVPSDPLWGIPLGVSLRETGSLLVLGEHRRARAVGRSMLLGLAATHSPLDLQIAVLTTEERAEDWNWVRWLPHTFSGRTAARVQVTADQRDAFMASLVQRIDTWEGEPPSNALLVLVDGAHIVDGSLLTSVLRRGSRAGVLGVVLDPRITPEGVRGTLRLGGMPDEGVFTSSTLAETEGILTAELAVSWAEAAALAMAGLQPASASDASVSAAEVHLVDLLSGSAIDAGWVKARWQGSPRESVLVGLAGRTPVSIDFVRHGPHAIVGGATRSGKTEFLLTWLTSLCLHNSPDDLAILVADFKGGVDHVQTARLPHVVSLSTNQDIRAFERTLTMLEAEIKRREERFSRAGTSNIEAYRVARKRDSSLVPVPRLLVVVDEFSELRQTDREGGGGYLGRLESVARVGAGLGVHLVLVTQNFAGGQLPEQIESQIGLGVCFRVEDGSHSKVVLRSTVAASIPADRPGRAWARLRGLDLQEFQAARVAGRRRELDGAGSEIQIERVPFTTVASAAPDLASGAVPHQDTDLASLISVVSEAAGGARPPVPWPGELDSRTTLAAVIERARREGSRGPAFGLADLPNEQVQHPTCLTPQDEQILVIGSAQADVGEALLTLAAAEALDADPADLHLYGIDLEANWLQSLTAFPHTGAVACLNDDVGLRIVRRLRSEAERRRALFDQIGVNDLASYQRRSGDRLPRIRLYLNGADRLAGSSESDVSPLMRPVGALVADTPGTGIGVVVAGGPVLLGRRIVQRINRRLVLPLLDTAMYGAAGVPRSVAVDLSAPRRAYDASRKQVVQLGRLSTSEHSSVEVVDVLGHALRGIFDARGGTGYPEPMPEVRWPLPWARLDASSVRVPVDYGSALPVGVDAESGRWHWLDVEEDGPLFAIGGPSKSGRSGVLVMLAELAQSLGWAVQSVAPNRRSPIHRLDRPVHEAVAALAPALTRPTLYLIDDVNRIDADETLTKVIDESTMPILIAVAGPDDLVSRKVGPLRGTPELRAAITLGPTSSSAVGGGRIPDHLRIDPRPGRGVLWYSGDLHGVLVPLHPVVDPPGPAVSERAAR
jgi:S-DNA-T family DNA segregation ATPase FtsK/SpoIIIE